MFLTAVSMTDMPLLPSTSCAVPLNSMKVIFAI